MKSHHFFDQGIQLVHMSETFVGKTHALDRIPYLGMYFFLPVLPCRNVI